MSGADLDAILIDGGWKGIPGGGRQLRVGDVAAQHWNLLAEDLPLPAALIRQSALAHNMAWMGRLLAAHDVMEAPHGKTAMCPGLVRRQIEAGAWGVTVSSSFQLQAYLRHGVRNFILANQLVTRAAIDDVLAILAAREDVAVMVLVDSVATVQRLAAGAARRAMVRPLDVLLEVGADGGRSGCMNVQAGLEVARAVAATSGALRLCGIEGYEGVIAGDDPVIAERDVAGFLDRLAAVAAACHSEGLLQDGTVTFSAGGSVYIDLVLDWWKNRLAFDGPRRLLVQTGSYVLSDSVLYPQAFARMMERSPWMQAFGEGPRPVMELWSCVQARPSPTRVTLTMGKRDTAEHYGLPVTRAWFRPGSHDRPQVLGKGNDIVVLNDQHALMTCPADSELAVGDMVACGVCYPCGTTDKWRLLLEVDDAYNVVAAHPTFF